MLLLLCLLLPPIGVLFCGKPGKFVICCILCLLGYIPGMIYGLMVYSEHKSDKRFKRLEGQISQQQLAAQEYAKRYPRQR